MGWCWLTAMARDAGGRGWCRGDVISFSNGGSEERGARDGEAVSTEFIRGLAFFFWPWRRQRAWWRRL